MKKGIHYRILLFAAPVLALFSCERRPLEEEASAEARIPIGVEWETAGIAPQNVSVLFYRESDGQLALEHRYEHHPARIQSYASVPPGKYRVIVFNELRNQIDYVHIRNFQDMRKIEAFATPNTAPLNRVPAYSYVNQPGVLALALIEDFEVTHAMLLPGALVSQRLVGIVPFRRTGVMDLRVHVRGLNNARMPVLVDLKNIAGSCLLIGEKNSTDPVVCQFTMNNRRYEPGSATEGTISTSVSLFGVTGDRYTTADQPQQSPVLIDLLFMLTDEKKTLVNHCVDITQQLTLTAMTDGSVVHQLELYLKEPLPDVIPEGTGENSGFGSELVDWDIIEIPLISN